MPRGVPSEFWSDRENQKLFLKLCKLANKPSVSWKIFRSFDNRNLFKNFSVPMLSAQFRKLRLIKKGVCWQCGKKQATHKNGMCDICIEYVKQIRLKCERRNDAELITAAKFNIKDSMKGIHKVKGEEHSILIAEV